MLSTAPSSRASSADRDALARWATQPFSQAQAKALTPATARPFVVARPSSPRAVAIRHAIPRSRVGLLLPLLVTLFAVLNAGDLLSTFIGLAGGMREGNPLMNMLLVQYGFGALILYKVVVIVAVGAGVLFLSTFHRRIAHVTIWVCNLLVLGVVFSNLMQFAIGR